MTTKQALVSARAWRLLMHFRGIMRLHGRLIIRLRYLARYYKCTERTVSRWISELKSASYLAIQRRGRKACKYSLLSGQNVRSNSSGLFTEPSERANEKPKQKRSQKYGCSEAPEKSVRFVEVRMSSQINITIDSTFEQFLGIFVAAGKPMNHGDVSAARVLWGTLPFKDRQLAAAHVSRQLERTADPRFMPLPANYLRAKPWTRTSVPRSLRYIDPRAEQALDRHEEVQRILEQQQRRAG